MRINENQGVGSNWNQCLDLFQNQGESTAFLFKNHRESMRIIKNQKESMRINDNQGLDLFENQPESIPDIFENHWKSFKIIKNH